MSCESSLRLFLPSLTRLWDVLGGDGELTNSNRLVGSCHKKCIAPDDAHRYHEGELLKGEAVCIDRCTSKFFEVSFLVSGKEETHS